VVLVRAICDSAEETSMNVTRPCGGLLLALGAASVGCSDGVAPPPTIEIVSGDGQTGMAGEALAVPLRVRVTEFDGARYYSPSVVFRVTSGDGVFDDRWEDCSYLEGEQRGNPVQPFTVAPDVDGFAEVAFTPLSFGPITVVAQTARYAAFDSPEVTFTIDATDPGATLVMVSGDNQEGVETLFGAEAFVARLSDGRGEPVAGVAMVWEVTSGRGDLMQPFNVEPPLSLDECRDLDTIPDTRTTRTVSDGTSGSGYQPEVAGVNTVSASVAGAQGSPVTFTLDVVQAIYLNGDRFNPATVSVPVGATVRWHHFGVAAARIVSTSTPPGGTSFDSGPLEEDEPFQFVPDAVGTWEYVDEVSGELGTLTAF
jgi:plastocyanin